VIKKWGGWKIVGTFHGSNFDKDSDSALIAATKCGNTHAFGKLVSRYKPRILAVAQRLTKNREDAEDVVQESFHRAFVHINDFQEKSLFSTWLTRITMNEAFAVLRRRRKNVEPLPENRRDMVDFVPREFVDQRPNPEESFWRRERADILAKAINCLGPTVRRTIVLRDIEDRSMEETAQILGTSISAVKSRLFHGRRQLSLAANRGGLCKVYATESLAPSAFEN
jgi:RNA polymerase sigma-70 factor, ECF subfamily